MKKDYDVVSQFLGHDMEPGLRERVDTYNEMTAYWEKVFVISLHVDASPSNLLKEDGWADNIKGTTIFTSRGDSPADEFATVLGESIRFIQPHEKYRFDYGLSRNEVARDLDREANFTVLAGYRIDTSQPAGAPGNWVDAKYEGVLIENGFMTSRDDVQNLLDDAWCRNREEGIIKGISNWFHGLGLGPKYL
jgi:N-acetylmuramoyl-L-alanine amidase